MLNPEQRKVYEQVYRIYHKVAHALPMEHFIIQDQYSLSIRWDFYSENRPFCRQVWANILRQARNAGLIPSVVYVKGVQKGFAFRYAIQGYDEFDFLLDPIFNGGKDVVYRS